MNILKKIGFLAGLGGMLLTQSCTDLTPTLYSEIDQESFENSEEAFLPKLGDVYVNLQREYGYVYREGYWSLQENTTDECIVPTRYAGDWLDGQAFWNLHNHLFTSKLREISQNGQSGNNAWAFAYRGISKCNSMIKWMRSIGLDQKRPADMAELIILRCWYHYILLDSFGNIPYVTSIEEGYTSSQGTRAQVYDSIMTDLNTYVPLASTNKTYSRVNKYVGWMVMAKMNLNAEVWGVVGDASLAPNATECYNNAKNYCDSIIKKGGYELTNSYFENFYVANEGSTENIWCVFYDANFSKGMQFHMMTLHYASKESYNLKNEPWNGYCTSHRVIGLYGDNDERVNCWVRGQQRTKAGTAISVQVPVDGATYDNMPEYVRKSEDYPTSRPEGEAITCSFPAFFTDTITTLTNNSANKIYNVFEGARFVKFQIEEGVGDHMSNDFPIFRLADVYLMKAEAIMRANGGTANQEAIDAANEVRDRAGAEAYNTSTLTLDELCNERCRELCWEGHRRQDLIRFGRFTGTNSVPNESDPYNLWILKQDQDGVPYGPTEDYKKIFPLPDYAVDNGYTQNDGYTE